MRIVTSVPESIEPSSYDFPGVKDRVGSRYKRKRESWKKLVEDDVH